MKILFVSSGNNNYGVSPIIKNQGLSLEKKNCEVIYFTIIGKGFFSYMKSIPKLRKVIKRHSPDVVHAHYSFSGIIASLACAKPIIVSLMGSDVKAASSFKTIIKLFSKFSWNSVIVKSQDMKISLGLANVEIIPNGVDTNKFKPLDKVECQNKLGWDINQKHILFAASPKRKEKNFSLAQDAFNLIKDTKCQLHYLDNVPNSDMPIYLNAADVVLLTSLWEGSPNVIKEAMACNRPIVSTDVGDVKHLFGSLSGCYITSYDVKECASLISKALKHNRTDGLQRIVGLDIDDDSIAQELLKVYESDIAKHK